VFIVAGALFWERLLAARPIMRGLLFVTLLSGFTSVPTAAPVLPIERVQQIADFIRDGQQGFPGSEPAALEPLFPHFAEMHGWPELVRLTSDVYAGFSEKERDNTTLVAAYYGQAGALNQLDDADALPEAYSGHMSYDLWNREADLNRVLFVGFERGEIEDLYTTVEELGALECRYCMSREDGLKLYLAEGLRAAPAQVRDRIRRYYFF
jgi:hypothetical protein